MRQGRLTSLLSDAPPRMPESEQGRNRRVHCGIRPAPAEPVGNPDEVTVQDMKKALDNPGLGIKVIDVREADEYEIAKVDGVPLLALSQINERFTELDPNQQYYLHCKAGVRSLSERRESQSRPARLVQSNSKHLRRACKPA